MNHRFVLKLAAFLVAGWAVAMVAVLALAPPPAANDRVVVVFPFGTGDQAALAKVSHADGLLIQGTWWPDAWVATGRTDAFDSALKAQGAHWVLPAAPFRLASIGGCGFPIFRWRISETH